PVAPETGLDVHIHFRHRVQFGDLPRARLDALRMWPSQLCFVGVREWPDRRLSHPISKSLASLPFPVLAMWVRVTRSLVPKHNPPFWVPCNPVHRDLCLAIRPESARCVPDISEDLRGLRRPSVACHWLATLPL